MPMHNEITLLPTLDGLLEEGVPLVCRVLAWTGAISAVTSYAGYPVE